MSIPWIFFQLMLIGIFEAGDAIFCGLIAEKEQFKYLVKIIREKGDPIRYCSGAIIDSSHILTAAHCVFDSFQTELSVLAGTVVLRSQSQVERKVKKIHIHEEYRFEGSECGRWGRIQEWYRSIWEFIKNERGIYRMQNDIAVLTLDEFLPLGDNIQTVNLPKAGLLPYCFYCEYAGWGEVSIDRSVPPRLQWIYMVILFPEDCRDFDAKHYSNQFCAIHPDMKSCPLAGDSGAPLVHDNAVIGITSNGCGVPDAPTIFTKVFDHLDFIRKALSD